MCLPFFWLLWEICMGLAGFVTAPLVGMVGWLGALLGVLTHGLSVLVVLVIFVLQTIL